MTIAIIDYAMGNVRSVLNAVRKAGGDAEIVGDPAALGDYQKIILPGVGAFGEAMEHLRDSGLDQALSEIARTDTPVLGICLGMQLMCQKSFEHGEHEGLGWIEAEVLPLASSPDLKVPHIGWNDITFAKQSPITVGLEDGLDFYFVHSYHVHCANAIDSLAYCDYGVEFSAMFSRDNLYGIQFHPEKSQRAGLKILENFVGL